jgi:pyruvate-formate lyase-activating enzyme
MEFNKKVAAMMNLTLDDVDNHLSATIFFQVCNLTCNYCYNTNKLHEAQKLYSVNELKEKIQKELEKTNEKTGKKILLVDYIVFSGGECTLYTDELNELLKFVKDEGFKTAIYTNGYIWNSKINYNLVDFMSVDIKGAMSQQDKLTELIGVEHTNYLDNLNKCLIEINNFGIPYNVRTVILKPYFKNQDLGFMYCYIKGLKKQPKAWYISRCKFGETLDPKLNEIDNGYSLKEFEEFKNYLNELNVGCNKLNIIYKE